MLVSGQHRRMNVVDRPLKTPRLTGESRVLRGGQIGGWIDGRSAEGRFLAKVERGLAAQLGGATPTFVQKMLFRRAARALLRLELLDEKAAAGSWTDHDARTFGGLNNAVRQFVREIAAQASLPAGKAKAPELGDYVSQRVRRQMI